MAVFKRFCRFMEDIVSSPIGKMSSNINEGLERKVVFRVKPVVRWGHQKGTNNDHLNRVRLKNPLFDTPTYNCYFSYETTNFLEVGKYLMIQKRTIICHSRQVDFLKPSSPQMCQNRRKNCAIEKGEMNGLVLGLFTRDDDPYGTNKTFTKFAEEFDKKNDGKLSEMLYSTGPVPKRWESKLIYKLGTEYTAIAIVGLGDECAAYNELEQIDQMKEHIRGAAAAGVRLLQENNMKQIYVDSFGNAESAAEGAAMGVWAFQELRNPKRQMSIPRVELQGDCDYTGWQIGLQKAAAQNLARQLCETPANLLTPLGLAQAAVEILCKAGVNVEVKVRDWCRIMEMQSFLSAAKGSCEPPVFLEISYYGCDPDVAPAVLVGKGVTFDSGGLCLKRPCESMRHMRGDMAGAACVIAATRAAAALQLPINIRGLMPLYENLPGTCAMKPGDIIRARNGKTVLIHNTDYDGRLSLADALSYAGTFNPKFIADLGTLSIELEQSLGTGASAVFSNNDQLYETLRVAATHSGDRMWRLPLWNHYSHKVKLSPMADVQDKEIDTGMPCTCAAFLREFIPPVDWLHIDTYAVAIADGSEPYLRPGMSGRPTRTIIEFLGQLSCRTDIDDNDKASESAEAPAK